MKNNKSSPFDLYDAVIKSSITFESESDALFAAFCLGDKLGCELLFLTRIIDAFIGFLKHPRFHGDQLTFESTDDMIEKITQYRRDMRNKRLRPFRHMISKRARYRREGALERKEVALKRPTPDYGSILAGNIPKLVLELVAENLATTPRRVRVIPCLAQTG